MPSSRGARLQADAGRRALLRFSVAAAGAAVLPACGTAAERGAWGEDQGYPSGWGPPGQPPRWEAYPAYRVGNFSGGFERMFRHTVLRSGRSPSALHPSGRSLAYDPQSHVRAWPVTGLLIARDGEILFESYAMGRSAEMRMTGWSMSKSVTSLLFGIALDRGIVRDLDDTPERYVPSLAGTLHGRIAFRHLLNMSSGAEVDHARDPVRIDVPALLGPPHARATGTDVERVLRAWDGVREPPGTRFNYNELCPLVIGMTLRHVTGDTLARFAEEALWHPLGAEADATWLADSLGREYNCVGFAARLRDWARLGQMIAQRGRMGDRQVVSAAYIESCRSWGPQERQVAHGVARSDTGYRNFFWHPRRDGRWVVMNGAHGQRLAVDVETRTVMVQTAVAAEGAWSRDFYALFETAIRG